MATFNKISPCLWFDGNAEEAAAFYTKVFDDSRVVRTVRNPASAFGEEGDVLLVDFVLEGLQFTALNGGPMFTFSEAISFQLLCKDQAEIDRYWDALVEGGEEQPCGWLKDRFGVSWQRIRNETASSGVNCGPPFSAVIWRPSISKSTSIVVPACGPSPEYGSVRRMRPSNTFV